LLYMPTGPGSADVSLETALTYPIGAVELMNENSLLLLPAGPTSADVSLDSVGYYTLEQLEYWKEERLLEMETAAECAVYGEDDDVTLYWSSPQNPDPQTGEATLVVDKGKRVDMSPVSQDLLMLYPWTIICWTKMDEDLAAEGGNEFSDEFGWENISAAIEESRVASRKNSIDYEPATGESSHVSADPQPFVAS